MSLDYCPHMASQCPHRDVNCDTSPDCHYVLSATGAALATVTALQPFKATLSGPVKSTYDRAVKILTSVGIESAAYE